MQLLSQIVGQSMVVAVPTMGMGRGVKRRLVLDEMPVEIVVEIGTNLDFEGFGNLVLGSSFMRCILRKYWRSILPFIIEREFGPVGLFFQALSTAEVAGVENGRVSARELLGRLSPAGGDGGGGGGGRDRELDRMMNFCRSIKLWEGEFQRLRFYDCEVEHIRLMTDKERERFRRGLYIWTWFARVHHSGRQSRGTTEAVSFMRRFSTTELHELNDVWETVWAAVGREVCPAVSKVMEVIGDTALAEGVGWGDGEENVQILGTMMKLGPGDLLRLLRGRIEDSTEVLSIALLSVKHEREKMTGMVRTAFPVEGFPGRYGGVLDHETAEGEELRAVHGADGGRDWCHSGRYGRGNDVSVLGGVREGRLIASRY
ncbi:hypothetical protein QBC41DRAFT_352601 [Cercophora samala]|uniref:F-box domain-containing protein n=1 Tax=Cercophora samala TaxID=330535 RepID=A0AA39ZLY5_9PEZI|nr:hypothetical protein QBC41DRAFT_352601 [Cercophora samala]